MKYIKQNYKFMLILISILLLFSIRFPYYIDAPGGISDMNKKIDMDGYTSEGSFNVAYVKEYRATIPTLVVSLFNKYWDVVKETDVMLENETVEDYNTRDKLFMDESISNAIYVAYTKANKKIEILNSDSIVLYVDKLAKTDLVVGDIIFEIEENNINSKEDITEILKDYNIGDRLNIKVKNNNKEYTRYAYLIELENEKKLGILLVTLNEYKLNPNIKVNIEDNESGSSGGLIAALTIYDNLVKEDITKGLTIVGTGTIDINGNVGTIGGVSYKLKSAVANNADLFLVPTGDNYEEAIKIKKEKGYEIDIIGVNTIDDALKYLENVK